MLKNKKGKYAIIGAIIGLFIAVFIIKTSFLKTNENEIEHHHQIVNKIHKLPILMYHTVKDGSENNILNTKPANFKEQMDYLKEQGFVTLTPFDLEKILYENAEVPDKAVMITFDDGYKDNYTNAYPILKENEMQATIFIIASRILHNNKSLEEYPDEFEKISWEDIEEMRDFITIQNHTWDSHKIIDNGSQEGGALIVNLENEPLALFKQRITNDLTKAQNTIEEKLGYPSVMIAYPYGHYNDIVIDIAKEVGLKIGTTVKSGTNQTIENPLKLERITVDGNYTGEEIVKLIEE
jgi:peptidoglycan/xylan/chitin deacetylase (PgdA/CDA1 family)